MSKGRKIRMKILDMSDYNRAARVYWFALVIVGSMSGLWAFHHSISYTVNQWLVLGLLTALIIVSSSLPVRIPGTASVVTISDMFVFLSMILLGAPAAILLGSIDSVMISVRTSKRVTSMIASPAVMAISYFVSGNFFYYILSSYLHISLNPVGYASISPHQLFISLTSAALLQYFLNSTLVSTLLALKKRASIWEFLYGQHLWTCWTFFAGALVAALVYLAIIHSFFIYILLGVPVIWATYTSYKIYFERVSEKIREADEMSRLHLVTVEALATAIDAKDQTTHGHIRRMQIYATSMGKLFNLSDDEIKALKAGALLHDIGKLAVPDHILNKPGKLTAVEFEKMKAHSVVGAQILERVNFPYPVVPIVRHHHEHWDGSGYPDGLKNEEIPLTARIITVVDCFDSTREDRPFRRGLSREEAKALLKRNSGKLFDPKVVEVFLANLPKFEAEIAALGLGQLDYITDNSQLGSSIDTEGERHINAALVPEYLDQIKNAQREVYALYEIARTFGSSLEVEETISILVDKVGYVVPFDTCVVYIYNEKTSIANAAYVAGRNAATISDIKISLGKGVMGFIMTNRWPMNHLDPMEDFEEANITLDGRYHSMIGVPLVKGDRLLGAIAVYSIEPSRYSNDHTRLLDTIARLASDALANALHHAEAESNSLTDILTGLPNARALYSRFDQEVSRANRINRPFQVFMMDLDGFKQVNDVYGHKIGDKLLYEVGQVLQKQLRDYDFLARYAGDEFVAIAHNVGPEQGDELRERIEKTISQFSLHVGGDTYARVGISVGSATYKIHGETLDQLLIAADQSMYRVKASHKQQNTIPDSTDLTSLAIN
jgi:diguanylate cyclase (GGDEF)-like protein/putative nucleotidyltransferase with HDIG domain